MEKIEKLIRNIEKVESLLILGFEKVYTFDDFKRTFIETPIEQKKTAAVGFVCQINGVISAVQAASEWAISCKGIMTPDRFIDCKRLLNDIEDLSITARHAILCRTGLSFTPALKPIFADKMAYYYDYAFESFYGYTIRLSGYITNVRDTLLDLDVIAETPIDSNSPAETLPAIKEPSKKDCQIYLFIATMGTSQTKAAAQFFPKMTPSSGQAKISRTRAKVSKWLNACGLPTEQALGRLKEITIDPAKSELGKRTDGRKHGKTNRLKDEDDQYND